MECTAAAARAISKPGRQRRWLLKANRLDPDDPEPLILFYLSFAAAGQVPTANSVVGLNRAFELAPQDEELAMIVACQSLRDDRLPLARKALALVANDPHAAQLASKAAELLGRLDQPASAVERCEHFDLTW